MITFQLLSKDGSSLDDAEVLSGRWQAYVEGFVSDAETPGVPAAKVRSPFLRRYVHHHPSPLLSRSIITSIYLSIYLSISPLTTAAGLYPPVPPQQQQARARAQAQEREQGELELESELERDRTFTRAAGSRSKSASGHTVSSTSRGPKTCSGARPPPQKRSARTRGSQRGTPRVCGGSRSSR
jgi:hypothetical protein